MVLRWDFHTDALLFASEKRIKMSALPLGEKRRKDLTSARAAGLARCRQGCGICVNKFIIYGSLSPKAQF